MSYKEYFKTVVLKKKVLFVTFDLLDQNEIIMAGNIPCIARDKYRHEVRDIVDGLGVNRLSDVSVELNRTLHLLRLCTSRNRLILELTEDIFTLLFVPVREYLDELNTLTGATP